MASELEVKQLHSPPCSTLLHHDPDTNPKPTRPQILLFLNMRTQSFLVIRRRGKRTGSRRRARAAIEKNETRRSSLWDGLKKMCEHGEEDEKKSGGESDNDEIRREVWVAFGGGD
ncbi:hypothetical protein Tco_1308193 [Tanacetum coccineum]